MIIKGKLAKIEVGDLVNTRLMGIINLSPTSYFKKSIKLSEKEIQSYLESIIADGAEFVDVGAVSSAPTFLYANSEAVSTSTEIDRLSLFFNVYNEMQVDIPVSVDTQSSKTAEYALSQGALVINDISGFKSDPKLPHIVSEYSASAIIMACNRVPGDVFKLSDIISELKKSLTIGVQAGIENRSLIIDPGFGGWVPQRQASDDFQIINQLKKLRALEHCILLGISRKSFIGKILNAPPEKRLIGSLAATAIAILNGAHIIRTHDVKETKEVCLISDYLKKLREKAGLDNSD
ncbi:MAG: dihydropteroate synthase [Candidatus Heimdallarchaeota archaeon]|nr:MAG: dihydropteroate synthase [Candidatus Heimdallarchaeota archaeon]